MEDPAYEAFVVACPPAAEARRRSTRVYRRVFEAIRGGRLVPGTRLPSARRLALAWQVARAAVDDAFTQLQAEGLIERQVGNGSFVARRLPAGARTAAAAEAPPDAATREVLQRLALLAEPAAPAAETVRLRPGVPDAASFPLAAWRRELARALDPEDRAALSYGWPAGLPALRAATARHLSLTRSIDCRPEQVVIVGSVQQAVGLVAQVLLEPGDRVAVDDPGLPAAARLLATAGLQVEGVPLDAQGFDVEYLRRHVADAAAVLLQPLNQWPTGVRTAPARQRALLDWADLSGAWIVELDTLGEIVHDGAVPPPMAAADRAGRVLHLGSFSELMFPSLRLAWLLVPEPLVDVFAAVRGLLGEHSAVAAQAALATFIDEGALASHLRLLRRLYRTRRDALRDALARHLPALVPGPMGGALHACLPLHAAWNDRRVEAALRRRGVGAEALSRQAWRARGCNGLVLGYGDDEVDAIDAAVAEVARVLAP
ncbi:MAG: PLP-dependent aminotransferase family protein [Rubrivivax sp.]